VDLMKLFVTGSTGLLGNSLVRSLEAAGYVVVGLVRSEEKGRRLIGDVRAILIKGDMRNVQALAPALEGCDAVFHAATMIAAPGKGRPGERYIVAGEFHTMRRC
jgi:nucleoside-diphosphate-sugar epimerase